MGAAEPSERGGIFKISSLSRQGVRDLSEHGKSRASLTGLPAYRDGLLILYKIPGERWRTPPPPNRRPAPRIPKACEAIYGRIFPGERSSGLVRRGQFGVY